LTGDDTGSHAYSFLREKLEGEQDLALQSAEYRLS
jgi:hypothetical protein